VAPYSNVDLQRDFLAKRKSVDAAERVEKNPTLYKWNREFVSKMLDKSSGLRRNNVGVSHLTGPINFVNDRRI